MRNTIESEREATSAFKKNSPQSISHTKLGRLETSGKQKPPKRAEAYKLDDSYPSQQGRHAKQIHPPDSSINSGINDM